MIDFFGGGGIPAAPYIIHKVVTHVYTPCTGLGFVSTWLSVPVWLSTSQAGALHVAFFLPLIKNNP